jgi:hypothetical protein
MFSKFKQIFHPTSSFDRTVRNVTPEELLAQRDMVRSIWRQGGAGYNKRGSKGDDSLSSLYRLYHFVIIDDTIELRNELEFFFNKADWAVNQIPDPQDTNVERYVILAVLTSLIIRAFNRLIAKGLPRDAPAILVDFEALAERPKVLETVPSWAAKVAPLETPLKIPNDKGEYVEGPDDVKACKEFMEKGIWIEEPHIYFV